MTQVDNSLANPPPQPSPFSQARLVELWCAEPIFFASRELSDTYYTEGVIGNYAPPTPSVGRDSPYRLQGKETGKPRYIEDLTPSTDNGISYPPGSGQSPQLPL